MNTKTLVFIAVALAAVLVGGIGYVALGGGDDDDRRAAALTSDRTYSAGNIVLSIDGQQVGYLKSISGCGMQAPVIDSAEGLGKTTGAPTYGPCSISFGAGLQAPVYQWISDTLAGKSQPRQVGLTLADSTYKAQGRVDLNDAVLTRFTMPKLEASNSPVYFELELSPASITRSSASGTVSSTYGSKTKVLLGTGLSFSGQNLEQDALKVSSVDAWSFEVPLAPAGEKTAAGAPKLGNLTVTVNAPGGAQFDQWLGEVTSGKQLKRSLSVKLLNFDRTQTLVELNFGGAGLFEADLIGAQAGGETIAKRDFSMFVEEANFKVGAGAIG